MATGAKLPNSGINLINSTDVVDVGDINAISTGVESIASFRKAFPLTLNSNNILEIQTLPSGTGDGTKEYFYALSSGTYRSGPNNTFTGTPFQYGFYTIYHLGENDLVVIAVNLLTADTSVARANVSYSGVLKWNRLYHSGNFAAGGSGGSYYSRHPDGDLKCWGTFTPSNPIASAISSSGGFRSVSETVNFQHKFIDRNYSLSLTTLNPTADANAYLTTVQVYEKSSTDFKFFSVNPNSLTKPIHRVEWQAIGRWK